MRQLVLFSILVLTLFASCSENKYSEKDAKKQANKIIKILNESAIDTFRHWSYGTRGEAEIWQRLDSPYYFCVYYNRRNVKIKVGIIENFRKDFPLSLNIDTSEVHQITFKKIGNENINVSALTNFGQDTVLVKDIKLKNLFFERNPFKFFEELSKLKDRLDIIGTFYRPDIGNFIQFYMTPSYVLTYLPNSLKIASKYRDIWNGYFSTGINLSKNWNLRKLKEPLDNG